MKLLVFFKADKFSGHLVGPANKINTHIKRLINIQIYSQI